MSAAFPLLTALDEVHIRHQDCYRQLRRRGIPSALADLPDGSYLRFQLIGPDGEWRCRIEAGAWIAQQLPAMAGLAWSTMGPLHLAGLCETERPLHFATPHIRFDHAQFLGMCEHRSDHVPWPCMDSRQGRVWMEHASWSSDAALPAAQLPLHLELPIRLHLGKLMLSMQRLRRLRPHDIVLIPAARPRAWRGSRCLFEFDVNKESVTVNTLYPHPDDQPAYDLDDIDASEGMIDLAGLPIELDIVLCQLGISVAELSEIQAGMVLPLPEGAHRNVRIQHHGRPVAIGELVQVGDMLGVQVTTSPSLK